MGVITSRKPSVDAAIAADLRRRAGKHYAEGDAAFHAGELECPCSPSDTQAVQSWWAGWLDARTLKRLEPLFRRHRISWP